MPIITLTWNNIVADAQALAYKLEDTNMLFDSILAVTRGGLIPAGIIAQHLNIKMIETACIESYTTDKQQGRLRAIKFPKVLPEGRWVVIDDLADSGKTLKYIRNKLPHCHFATLYAKPTGEQHVDTFTKLYPQETWLKFPWESA